MSRSIVISVSVIKKSWNKSMILVDADIRRELESGNIICQPLEPANISNSSLDLRLGETGKALRPVSKFVGLLVGIGLLRPAIRFQINEAGKVKVVYGKYLKYAEIDLKRGYTLQPGEFILAHTLEYVGMARECRTLIAELADKSTIARCGLSVCFSAGYIDQGNALKITLEIFNHNRFPIELKAGQHICQIKFIRTESPCEELYDGKYLNSTETEGAK